MSKMTVHETADDSPSVLLIVAGNVFAEVHGDFPDPVLGRAKNIADRWNAWEARAQARREVLEQVIDRLERVAAREYQSDKVAEALRGEAEWFRLAIKGGGGAERKDGGV